MFFAPKVAFSWLSVDRFGKFFLGLFLTLGQVKVYHISANLVHRGLRNTTFEGKKIPTSISFPDPGYEPRKDHGDGGQQFT